VELSRDTLRDLQHDRPAGVETEVFAFGRLPLAYSARCFTARAHNLRKDDCGFRCLDHPDGIPLRTQEDVPFLVLNGIQTQSAQTFSLLGQLDALRTLGVDCLRLSPQWQGTERVVELFHASLGGELALPEAAAALQETMPYGPCDGYWHGQPGMGCGSD
jgi:collagenase-like PrtC family protease